MALSQSSKILVSDINSALAGKQDALGYTPVKSVNNVSPNSAGNVTISTTPSTVKGVISSAWAANSNSMTLPSGGTWFVWNSGGYSYYDGNTTTGVSNNSSKNSGYVAHGNTYSGGTTVYARAKATWSDGDGGSGTTYFAEGKIAAIRIA